MCAGLTKCLPEKIQGVTAFRTIGPSLCRVPCAAKGDDAPYEVPGGSGLELGKAHSTNFMTHRLLVGVTNRRVA